MPRTHYRPPNLFGHNNPSTGRSAERRTDNRITSVGTATDRAPVFGDTTSTLLPAFDADRVIEMRLRFGSKSIGLSAASPHRNPTVPNSMINSGYFDTSANRHNCS